MCNWPWYDMRKLMKEVPHTKGNNLREEKVDKSNPQTFTCTSWFMSWPFVRNHGVPWVNFFFDQFAPYAIMKELIVGFWWRLSFFRIVIRDKIVGILMRALICWILKCALICRILMCALICWILKCALICRILMCALICRILICALNL